MKKLFNLSRTVGNPPQEIEIEFLTNLSHSEVYDIRNEVCDAVDDVVYDGGEVSPPITYQATDDIIGFIWPARSAMDTETYAYMVKVVRRAVRRALVQELRKRPAHEIVLSGGDHVWGEA